VFERSDDIRTEPGTVHYRAKHMARLGKSQAALVGRFVYADVVLMSTSAVLEILLSLQLRLGSITSEH